MGTPRIVIDSDIPFIKGVLGSCADPIYIKGDEISSSDLMGAEVLITRTRTKCNSTLLENSSIKLIATATIGYDHIDMPYCVQRGITVTSAAGCNARGVLQYVMGALSYLSIKNGWAPREKTIGVVGVGNVGSLVAQYAKSFGFKVLCCDPPKKQQDPSLNYISLQEMLPQCDIVTLHVPFTQKHDRIMSDSPAYADVDLATEGMACKEFLNALPHGAIFINTSRGGIVDDPSLINALKGSQISDAIIDTWNGEPQINSTLLELATLATPHIAGYSMQGKAAATAAVVQTVSREFDMQLNDWYPPEVHRVTPNTEITWEEICAQMPTYFDIKAQSKTLKNSADFFEMLRDNYTFRTEFF